MSWSYSDQLTTDKDTIRWLVGDTDVSAQLLSDEHIAAVLALRTTVAAAIVSLAGELVARYGREPVRVTTNGLSVDYSERLATWRALMSGGSGGVTIGQLTYPQVCAGEDVPTGWRVR